MLLVDVLIEMISCGQKIIDNEVCQICVGEFLVVIVDEQINEVVIQVVYDDLFVDVLFEVEYNVFYIFVVSEEEVLVVQVCVDVGEDFVVLVCELLIGLFGLNGGELGWFGVGMMVLEFEIVVMNMEVGIVLVLV